MLVFGSRGYRFKRGSGTFHCPQCGGDREYILREMKRMGHVFFVPVLPLGSVGEYIECTTCKGEFDPRVLSMPTNTELEHRLGQAVRSALASMIRADSVVTTEERQAGVAVAGSYLRTEYNEADLERDLAEMDDHQLEDHLAQIAPHLTDDGRIGVLRACLFVAVQDGDLSEDEVVVMKRVARSLGVPEAYVPGIIQQTLQEWQRQGG